MKLYDISEPGKSKLPHENETDEIAIGIDLGTTNSLVAISYNSKPNIIYIDNKPLLKSVVASIKSFKKLMGKSFNEAAAFAQFYDITKVYGNNIGIKSDNVTYTPVMLSAKVLEKLKETAEKALSKSVKKAVITVPAYFDDAARIATKEAANLAGIDVLRLINEPTAAAIAYGLDKNKQGIYLIYDLGGGTFDVTLLRMENGVFHVIATSGDTNLGGDDYDIAIMESLGNTNLEPVTLKEICKEIKESLTSNDEVNIDGISFSYSKFKELTKNITSRTIKLVQKVIIDSGIQQDEIDGIVLVGGSTRMRVIKEALKVFNINILDDLNPDEVVALGAAIQAEGLLKGSEHLLLDVCPMSIGVEIMGGMVEKIIPRNSTIPASFTKSYTTYQDGQTAISFHIVQGEREMAADNRSLAKFNLGNIPPMKAGIPKVNVKFTMDADGILSVSAWEESTNIIQTIEVNPSHGLTNENIREMIVDALYNMEEDFEIRKIAETRAEIIIIKHQIESIITSYNHIDFSHFNNLLDKLANIDKYDELNSLNEILSECEKASESLAEIQLNLGLTEKFKGMKIVDLEKLIKEI